jgi:hypothetical protein
MGTETTTKTVGCDRTAWNLLEIGQAEMFMISAEAISIVERENKWRR